MWQEMWKEFKFALDLRAGDSKPVPKEGSDKSGSKSLLNEEESHYREISEGSPPSPKAAVRGQKEESPYATFNDDYGTTKSNKSKA